MNRVYFLGTLYKDWTLYQKDRGKRPIAFGTISDRFKDSTSVFMDVVALGRLAKEAQEETKAGDILEVKGIIVARRWQSKTGPRRRNIILAKSIRKVEPEKEQKEKFEIPMELFSFEEDFEET